MLTDQDIRQAVDAGDLEIEPLRDPCLQPASYDLRVGAEAFVSGVGEKVDVAHRGLVTIEAGELAVVTTRERVHCGPQVAGQLGLCSAYARRGLVLLSGPQVDPGFDGVLVVRVVNLAPRRVTLVYEAPFVTAQFFKLGRPVAEPYDGPRQGQTGLQPVDIEELDNPDSPTFGGMMRLLSALAADLGGLAADVAELKVSVRWMMWSIPVILTIGMAIVAIVTTVR